MAFLAELVRPFLAYIVAGLLAMALGTGLYFKIKHDGAQEALQKVETEKKDAVKKAKEARETVRDLCTANAACQLPDSWFRDD